MEIFGVQFAPLNVPMRRRLQTVAAAAWFITLAFGGFIGLIIAGLFLLFSQLYWLVLFYLIWVYLDLDISERGGRPIAWVRNWSWWVHFKNYFPLHLKAASGVELDPQRNYFFCCFPHGMLSTGVFSAFATNASEAKELFPHHAPYVATLHQHYSMPFFRELALSLGGVSCTAKAIEAVLKKPEGGNILVLMPGGAAEAYYCHPGLYKIILTKRKGFVRLALKTGAPLVPVISFGETDLYEQLESDNLKRFQEWLRKYIGLAPIIPIGRGFFQYSYGLIPRRREVTTVVGRPIDVKKIENPTAEDIEELHQKFTEELKKLFEEEKHKYLKKPEETQLQIV